MISPWPAAIFVHRKWKQGGSNSATLLASGVFAWFFKITLIPFDTKNSDNSRLFDYI